MEICVALEGAIQPIAVSSSQFTAQGPQLRCSCRCWTCRCYPLAKGGRPAIASNFASLCQGSRQSRRSCSRSHVDHCMWHWQDSHMCSLEEKQAALVREQRVQETGLPLSHEPRRKVQLRCFASPRPGELQEDRSQAQTLALLL